MVNCTTQGTPCAALTEPRRSGGVQGPEAKSPALHWGQPPWCHEDGARAALPKLPPARGRAQRWVSWGWGSLLPPASQAGAAQRVVACTLSPVLPRAPRGHHVCQHVYSSGVRWHTSHPGCPACTRASPGCAPSACISPHRSLVRAEPATPELLPQGKTTERHEQVWGGGGRDANRPQNAPWGWSQCRQPGLEPSQRRPEPGARSCARHPLGTVAGMCWETPSQTHLIRGLV